MAEIIATPTHQQANSYLTLEELDSYLSPFDWWAALTETRKKNAAILATNALDAVPYTGRKLFHGQRLEFPRNTHPIQKIEFPFLKHEDSYSAVGYHVSALGINSVSFYLDVFPETLTITYTVSGNTYTATMDVNGSISGYGLTGSCNKDTAYVELHSSTNFDIDTDISYTASGYNRFTVVSDALKLDPSSVLDDSLKYGAVRIVSKSFSFVSQITGNSVVSGEVYFADGVPIRPQSGDYAIVIAPIPEDIKVAHVIQVAFHLSRGSFYPKEGVRSIRIGDTQVVFNERTSGYSRYARLASRFGLSPAAFTRLVPYTIYGADLRVARS